MKLNFTIDWEHWILFLGFSSLLVLSLVGSCQRSVRNKPGIFVFKNGWPQWNTFAFQPSFQHFLEPLNSLSHCKYRSFLSVQVLLFTIWLFKRQLLLQKIIKHIQTICGLNLMDCLSVFDYFVGLDYKEFKLLVKLVVRNRRVNKQFR